MAINQNFFARFPVSDYGNHEPVDTSRYRKLYANVDYLMNVAGQVVCNTFLTATILMTGTVNGGTATLGTYNYVTTFGPFPLIPQARLNSNGVSVSEPFLYLEFNASSATDGQPCEFHFITRGANTPLTTISGTLSVTLPGQHAWTQTTTGTFQWFNLQTGSINIYSGTPSITNPAGGFSQMLVAFNGDNFPYTTQTYSGSNLDAPTFLKMYCVDLYTFVPLGASTSNPVGGIIKGLYIVERSIPGNIT